MPRINIPGSDSGEIKSVSDLLTLITRWRAKHNIPVRGYHSHAWFRGHSKRTYKLEPGVYRNEFTAQVAKIYGADTESKRLNLEREMLMEFRTAGASMIDSSSHEALYILAQHYGMPTRLLDWTANPLAALFFAVCNEQITNDGDVFVMEPTKMFPQPKSGSDEPQPYMRTIRHPQIRDAIGLSFWMPPSQKAKSGKGILEAYPRILAFRPDNVAGRVGQQSSCVTIHTHLSKPQDNITLARLKVVGSKKNSIREELRQLNINEFTVYNDLDHLSKELKRNWEL
jgi:FRG domain